MKIKLFVVGAIAGAVALYFGYQWETRKVHYHAGFLVYVDGKREDFTQAKYMKLEKCGNETNEDEQMEKAHLHDNVGEVVHVHRKGSKWGDLFRNIKYALPSQEVTAYINGKLIDNITSYPIKPYDSLVIIVGNSNLVNISDSVPVSRIKEVEGMNETCGNN